MLAQLYKVRDLAKRGLFGPAVGVKSLTDIDQVGETEQKRNGSVSKPRKRGLKL